MTRHVDLLGLLYLVWGGLVLMLGLSLLFVALGALAIAGARPGQEVPALVAAFVFGAVALMLLAGGAATAWTGSALRRRRRPARLLALGLALLHLLVVPFGTALGIYAYWTLLDPEARALFEPGHLQPA
jgi:hypothetical protein